MRLGEALKVEWIDIDLERCIIRTSHPEKGSNPRILPMSKKLANMIYALPKKSQKSYREVPALFRHHSGTKEGKPQSNFRTHDQQPSILSDIGRP